MSRALKYGSVSILFSLVIPMGWAASFGELSNNNLQSSATICLSVGVTASISGFDDFQLAAIDGDGSAGTIY